jgi:hypothetical protein
MDRDIPPHATVRARVKREIREFAVLSAYLFVCFAALAYLKAAILQAHGIAFAPFGFAAIKALICAKFILVGRAVGYDDRFKMLPLIWPTLYKSLAFLLLLVVLSVIEEVVVGFIHHRSVLASIADFGGGTLDQLIATCVVVLLTLIPFFAFRALAEIVGQGNLVRVFLQTRRTA